MRFTQASILGITALLSGISAPDILPIVRAEKQLRTQVQQRQLTSTPESSECVIQAIVYQVIDPESAGDDDDDDAIDFVCELEGKTYAIDLDDDQKQTMKDKLNNGELVSNKSTLIFEEGNRIVIDDEMIYVPPGQEITLGKSDSVAPTGGPEGDWPVLVVRVTDVNGKVTPSSTAQVSDDVFGTLGDPVNLKSQYSACSWGKLNIIPGDHMGKSDVPGVIDVTIPVALDEGHSNNVIRNSVTEAVSAKLGVPYPGPNKQVMIVLEGCYGNDCRWGGYAFINGITSVFKGHRHQHPTLQMHELGHNFGLAHSGYNGGAYEDKSCLMGWSVHSDDFGKVCFNGAKNWQIGWYDDKKETYTPSDQNKIWSKRMVGIANYGDDPDNHPVIVKIETGSDTDYFVAFNRAAGPNEQNRSADDVVTIISTGRNGEAYSQSWLQATLHQGETHTFSNWKGSGKDLTVTPEVINIAATVGYADVKICYGSCQTVAPTPAPTDAPTTKAPTSAPTTKAPTDAPFAPTPAPTDPPTTKAPTNPPFAPTPAPTDAPTSSPTTNPPRVCEDTPATFIFKRQRRDCKWIRDSSPDLCSVYKIKIMCPQTCETCEYKCSDAAYSFLPFYPEDAAKWSCSKLSGVKKVEKKEKNCALPNFYKTCRATCEPFIAPPPTSSPTASSTSSPTASPTIAATSSISWMLWTTPDGLVNQNMWDIDEIEFYETVDCSGDMIPNTGTAYDSGHYKSHENDKRYAPEHAFGGPRIWGGRKDSNGVFYIGMEYSDEKTVRCVKVFNFGDLSAKQLTVRAFNENEEDWDDIVVATDLDTSHDAVNIIRFK